MIKIANLTKYFANIKILNNINIDFQEGHIISLIGPSGSGKTTLLRCINGLERDYEGDILINKQNIQSDKNCNVTYKIATVFQNFNLFPHFTVLENLIYTPKIVYKISEEVACQAALAQLEIMGLSDKAKVYPKSLSGGQKQRVAIARAMMIEPKIILFDEPTSALDNEIIADLAKVIALLRQKAITILLITHNLNFAKHISDMIVFMERGEILEYKTTLEFFDNSHTLRVANFLKNLNI